jgi:predicted MFS family arabinose efflux permease
MSDAPPAVSKLGQDDEIWKSAAAPAGVAARTQIPATSWYALAVLIAVNFMGYMDRMALSILQEPIKADLHLSDKQLGLLSGLAFAAFYSTLGIPLARLADRFSRVKLISICLALWSVMTTLSGMTRTFLQLFLARMGVGVGEGGSRWPSASSSAARWRA